MGEMSSSAEAEADLCCANLGIAEVDEVKMEEEEEECASKLLHSCRDKDRKEHREQHDCECQKQVTKIHDDDLFRQPDETHLGECPLCFLPLPLDPEKSMFKSCCSKSICLGCVYSHERSIGGDKCPFCREPPPRDEEEWKKRIMERVKANDPDALSEMGKKCYYREGNCDRAFEYWTKAAELGDVIAHNQLATMYDGEGVQKDEEKEVYHLEKAAIGGHPLARHNLGCVEAMNGNIERAVKHFIIAANLGLEESMKMLWRQYSDGSITKEELEATLRTHKAALDEMKSPERDEAENYLKLVSLNLTS
jgi:TPR repeat protein